MSTTMWLGLAGTALVIIAYLPQIYHLLRSRCSTGISLRAYALWCLAGVFILSHAVSVNDPVFLVLQGYNLAATATIALFARRYQHGMCNACASHYRERIERRSGSAVEG